ncbi:hypothetical protein JX265_009486 [Neoarthrinium moseri]|uniref:Uncharacterized protein n=1 Tax=Neoarthrinium moseri TaxID=1658444 RepID=A0A9P9WG41_9PEZI|nr:hypothetical protein JX265_009486 [Neoarthrinium moseri]
MHTLYKKPGTVYHTALNWQLFIRTYSRRLLRRRRRVLAYRLELSLNPYLVPLARLLIESQAPTQGDAVLIQALDGGKRPDIAIQAGEEPLAEGFNYNEEDAKPEDDDDGADRHSLASSSTMSIGGNTIPPDLQPSKYATSFGMLAADDLAVPIPNTGTSPPLRDLESASVREQHHQEVWSHRTDPISTTVTTTRRMDIANMTTRQDEGPDEGTSEGRSSYLNPMPTSTPNGRKRKRREVSQETLHLTYPDGCSKRKKS